MNTRLFGATGLLALFIGCGTQSDNPPLWTAETISLGTSTTPVAVKVADMDADGSLDIVSVWRGTAATTQPTSSPGVAGGLAIHFHRGLGNWQTIVIDSGARYAKVNALAVGDANNDTRPDIVVAAMDRIIYLNAPANPTVATAWIPRDIAASIGTDLTAWFDVAIAQIDAQNGPDIVAALGTSAGRLCWLQAPVNPDAAEGWKLVDIDKLTRDGADSVGVWDLNGDGRLDIISTAPGETTDGVSWYENPADPVAGQWVKHAMNSYAGATRFAIGDLNGDGKVDIAAISPKTGAMSAAWIYQPDSVNSRWPGYLITNFATSGDQRVPTDVAIFDVDDDSQNDVVVSGDTPSGFSWFTPRSNNTQFWSETRMYNYTQSTPGLIAAGDLNGDGAIDVAVPLDSATNSLDQVQWLENPNVPAASQPAS